LCEHLPARETSNHRLKYADSIERTIVMIDSTVRTPPAHEQPGHEVDFGDDHTIREHRTVRSATSFDALDPKTEVIVGPHVSAAPDRWRQVPVLLSRAAERAWLLGAAPGEVVEVDKPPAAAWMDDFGLSGRLYEARAPFAVQHSVERWLLNPTLRIRQRGQSAPARHDGPPEPRDEYDVGLWTELLLTATPAGEHDADLLALYRSLASQLTGAQGQS